MPDSPDDALRFARQWAETQRVLALQGRGMYDHLLEWDELPVRWRERLIEASREFLRTTQWSDHTPATKDQDYYVEVSVKLCVDAPDAPTAWYRAHECLSQALRAQGAVRSSRVETGYQPSAVHLALYERQHGGKAHD